MQHLGVFSMFFKLLLSLIIVLIFNSTLLAQDSCIDSNWTIHNYYEDNRGNVNIYTTMQLPTMSDLICILGSEFFSNVYKFPEKNTLGIVNKSTMYGYLIQWSLIDNRFIVMKLENKKSLTLIYPDPLSGVQDLLTGNNLPIDKELPLTQQRHYRGLLIDFTEQTLDILLNIKK